MIAFILGPVLCSAAVVTSVSFGNPAVAVIPGRSVALQGQLGFEHAIITKFKPGEVLSFKVKTLGRIDWVTLYYRVPGIKEFQVRPLQRTGDSTYAFEFDTSTLTAPEFEYYIETQVGDERLCLPRGAPKATVRATGSGAESPPAIPENLPPPASAKSEFKFPLSTTGSVLEDLEGVPESSNLKNPSASGNIRVLFTPQLKNGWGANADSNFSWTNSAPPSASSVDLTNMTVGVTKDNHSLRAGDLNINESDLTAFGMGRRGVEYGFDNQKTYVHAFDISSQQVKGFQGLGIPPAQTNIFGAAAGYRFFSNAFSLKAVFLTGKDDPAQGANVGASPFYRARQGNVISLIPEAHLFGQCLKLKAELARSSYDGDLQDAEPEKPGTALSFGGSFSRGPFTVGGGVRRIGKDFDSIGLASFTNDRIIYDTIVGFTKGAVSIQGTYQILHDNVAGDASLGTTRGQDGNILVSLGLSSAISASLGYHHISQSVSQGDVQTPGTNSRSETVTGGVNAMFGPEASVNLTVIGSDLTSETAVVAGASSLNIALGGAFRAWERLVLNPTVGLSLQKDKSTGERNTTWTSMLSGEYFLKPQLFSVVTVASFNRTSFAGMVSQDLDLTGGTQVYIGKLLNFGSIVLAGKIRRHVTESAGVYVKDTRFLVQTDFAF